MSNFDEMLQRAQKAREALERKDRAPAKSKPPRVTKEKTDNSELEAALQKALDEQPLSESVKTVKINDKTVPTVEWILARESKLRDDFNEVMDNIEAAPATPREVILKTDTREIGKVEGAVHEMFSTLSRVAVLGGNVMMSGPTGSGKSTGAKMLAKALNLPFDYIGQVNMPHQVEGYVGQVDGKYYDTPFVRIFRDGGVFIAEEMDAWSPQATLAINPPLANGYMTLPNGEQIERHKDCIILAAANTWGNGATADYVGRNKLDAAFMDRFGYRIQWDYDEQLERQIAGNDDVVMAVQTARYNARKAGLKVIISPRSSIDCAKMVAAGFGIREAFNMNFLAGLSREDKNILMDGVAA